MGSYSKENLTEGMLNLGITLHKYVIYTANNC